ncbi:MAG: serine/threonine protein kinase [Halobacteriales archaeon]|nr:serine/threonine protein kinase [Halobacteriales archaeon]
MSFVGAYVAVGALRVVLGGIVLAARPGARANQVIAALLFTTAAANVAFQLGRESPDPAVALVWHRLGSWYEIPASLLALALVLDIHKSAVAPRLRQALLAIGAIFTLALLVGFALEPELLLPGLRGGATGFFPNLGPLAEAEAIALDLALVSAVVLGARGAVDASRTAAERKQAALVGIAFFFILGHTGGLALGPYLRGAIPAVLAPSAVANLIVGLAPMLLIPRLSRAFEGRARTAVLVAGFAPVFGGLFDTFLIATLRVRGWLPAEYVNGRLIWIAALSVVLAVAVVRYGLAGFSESMQRRMTRITQVALLGAVAALPAAVVLAVSGGSTAGLAVAALLGVGAVVLSPTPARETARRVVSRLLLDPGDPTVTGERARVYAQALQRHLQPDGTITSADATTLRELRRELDISEREHHLLLQALRGAAARAGARDDVLLGRYRVERELGRGAFGTAFLALDSARGEQVVLKRYHAGRSERRAHAEARALAAVRHPRVVPLLDVQRVGEELFLVLGYMPGGSAKDMLERGPLPAERCVALTLDLLEGLAALHAEGLVHRDVKPSNLLLDAQGRGVLGDFGSARFALPDHDLTVTGAEALGSYATLAPEVLRGARANPQADVYAAGAVLYRLLTGEHYVDLAGRDALQLRQAILHNPPRLPHPRVPKVLAPVLRTALEKQPDQRYASALDMRAALLAAHVPSRRVSARGTRAASAPPR